MPGAKQQARTEEELEREISGSLRKLPKELRDRWTRENEEATTEDRHASLMAFVARREKALEADERMSRSARVPNSIENMRTTPLAVSDFIEKLQRGKHEMLGKGKSAAVIASLRNPELCHKVFYDQEHQPPGTNTIDLETEYQADVARLGELHGVRAPRVYYYNQTEQVTAITMERINGPSIQDVMEGHASMPPAFEADRFFASLRAYVGELHARGFFHRDIHEGNVLVDADTGMPYLIDFGHATRALTEEDAYRSEYVKSGHIVTNVLPSDESGIQATENKYRNFALTKGGEAV